MRLSLRGLKSLLLGTALVWSSAAGCNGRLYFDQHSVGGSGAAVPAAGAASGGGAGHEAGGGEFGGSCKDRCKAAELLCHSKSLRCVECESDVDCRSKGLGRCNFEGRCVECFEDHDCQLFRTAASGDDDDVLCEPVTKSCVTACYMEERPCREEYECEYERRACVQCESDAECSGVENGHHCIGSRTRCGCRADAECGDGFCDPVLFVCVACRDSRDCRADELCEPKAHRCRQY